MKRFLSVLLATIIISTLFGLNAFAKSDDAKSDNGKGNIEAKFYILNDNSKMASSWNEDLSQNHTYIGDGRINTVEENLYNSEDKGLHQYVVNAPSDYKKTDYIWYIIKEGTTGWEIYGMKTTGTEIPSTSTSEMKYFISQGTTDNSLNSCRTEEINNNSDYFVKNNMFENNDLDFVCWASDGSGKIFGEGIVAADIPDFSQSCDYYAPGYKLTISENHTFYGVWKNSNRESLSMGVVTPKKMSIRFQDGSIYKTGDEINLLVGKEYKFQMCSNNWDNDIYSDDGNGISGTVVYTVRVSERFDERSYNAETKTFVLPKGDPVLRTDVNKCFMAYKYHFESDYNKQTGIEKVVNNPLESLSVNLPLGSTIKSDAYIGFEFVGTDDVFIENDKDPTISYTDYMWSY